MSARSQHIRQQEQLWTLFRQLGHSELTPEEAVAVSEPASDLDFFNKMLELNHTNDRQFYELLASKNLTPPDDLEGEDLYAYLAEKCSLLPIQPDQKQQAPLPINEQPLTLMIEPRLKAAPDRVLKEWAERSEDEIRELREDDVEYYIQSPEPLDQFEGILRYDCQVKGRKDTVLYQYRLNGNQISNAIARGFMQQAPFKRFTPASDAFSLFPEHVRQKYGVGIVKIKSQFALVVRSHNGTENDLLGHLRDAGFLGRSEKEQTASTLRHSFELLFDGKTTSRLGIVYPISAELATSIARGHGQTSIERHDNIPQVKATLNNHPELFAPLAPPPSTTKVIDLIPSEEPRPPLDPKKVLHRLLKAYGATITARRQGNGETRYRLELDRSPQWSMIADITPDLERLREEFPSPADVTRLLSETLNLQLLPNPNGAQMHYTVPSSRLEHAQFEMIAKMMRKPFSSVKVAPFTFKAKDVTRLEESNGFRMPGLPQKVSGKRDAASDTLNALHELRSRQKVVHFYLMRDEAGPHLVAVASRKQFTDSDAKQFFKRFSLHVPGQPQIIPLLARRDQQIGESIEQFAARIPVPENIFDDLRNLTKLPTLKAMTMPDVVEELGVLSEQPPPVAPAKQILRDRTAAVVGGFEPKESRAERKVRDEQTLLESMQSMRGRMEHFYVAMVEENGEVRPYAYMISNVANQQWLHNRLRNIRLTDSLHQGNVMRILDSGGGKRIHTSLIEVAITPEIYEQLARDDEKIRQYQPEAETVFLRPYLSLPDASPQADVPREIAVNALKTWTQEVIADLRAQLNRQVPDIMALQPLLRTAAKHTQGRMLQVLLPEIEVLDAQIARLEQQRAVEEKHLKPTIDFRANHRIIKSYVTLAEAQLKPESHGAKLAMGKAQEAANAAEEALRGMTQEIAELRKLRSFIDVHGRILPAISLRGATRRFGPQTWQRLEEAVDRPHRTVEGSEDREAEHPRRLLATHQALLGAGKRGDNRAQVMLLSPSLWAQIAPEFEAEIEQETAKLTAGQPSERLVSATPIPYAELLDTVAQHYAPNHSEGRSVNIPKAFRALGLEALIAYERIADTANGRRVRTEDKGSQPALYLVVTKQNADKAVQLLSALAASDGIAAPKRYDAEQTRALFSEELVKLQQRRDEIRSAQKYADDMDSAVARAVAQFTKPAIEGDTVELQFQAKHMLEIVQDPSRLIEGVEDNEGRFALYQSVVRPRRQNEPKNQEAVVAWLTHVAAHGTLPQEGASMQTVLAYLAAIPSLSEALRQAQYGLDGELREYLQANPTLRDSLNLVEPTVAALNGEAIAVQEAVATHGNVGVQLFTGKRQTEFVLEEGKDFRRELTKQLKELISGDETILLSCPLSPLMIEALEPARQESPARYQQQLINEARNWEQSARRTGNTRAARALDAISSSHQGRLPAEIRQALGNYHGLQGFHMGAGRA